MLSEEEKREIEEAFRGLDQNQAACIEALKIVQRHRGWVSDEAIKDTAAFLEMTPEELDSVATFYSLIFRKAVGRHVILMCDSASCWIMGYVSVLEHLTSRLGITFGQTSSDKRFTLLPIACLGACDRAPALMIDEDLHTDLTPARLDEILEGYR